MRSFIDKLMKHGAIITARARGQPRRGLQSYTIEHDFWREKTHHLNQPNDEIVINNGSHCGVVSMKSLLAVLAPLVANSGRRGQKVMVDEVEKFISA